MKQFLGCVTAAMWGIAVSEHGSPWAFVDLPSVALVFGGALTLSVGAHSTSGVITAIGAGLGLSAPTGPDIKTHVQTLGTLRSSIALMSGLGLSLGVLGLMKNMSDLTAIGPCVATALLSTFYGLLASELALGPMINRLVAHSEPRQEVDATHRAAGWIRPIVVCAVGCVGVAAWFLTSGFFDPSSFVLVFGTVALLALFHHTPTEIAAAFRASHDAEGLRPQQRAAHLAVLTSLRMTALAGGLAGTMVGCVKMLSNLSDPSALGPAMAVAWMAALYGALLSEGLIRPFQRRLTRGPSDERAATSTRLAAAHTPVLLLSFLSVTGGFAVMLLATH